MLSYREEVLQSWIAAVDRDPKISASDNLTFTQLLDHLPELCTELAALLKRPNAEGIKKEAARDAKAHGWKRWRQGYKLDELIREICLVRRNFIDTWLPAFAAIERGFDLNAQKSARRVVERFLDNVIIEATVQFVEEHDETTRQVSAGVRAEKRLRTATKAELVHLISHQLREPLGPLLIALDVLRREEPLSGLGIEMIRVLESGIKAEARAVENFSTS